MLTKPPTVALNPFRTIADCPAPTLSGALTAKSPIFTSTVRSMSTPVVLKATVTESTDTEPNSPPRLRSATPVASTANFWSPRITMATVAPVTPTRIA